MCEAEKQRIHEVQAKFFNFFQPFRNTFSKPRFRFLREMAKGMLSSRSVIVRRAAIEMNESILLKKTCERFYRHLQTEDLDRAILEPLLAKQCRKIGKNDVICVDDSDIIKPFAERMEGLRKVHDGSQSRMEKGYNLINFISVSGRSDENEIVPLSSDLHSSDADQDSITNRTLDRIDDITLYSGNHGVFTMDRGFDSRNMLSRLVRNGNAFIIRSTGKRNLVVNGWEEPFGTVAGNVKQPYRIQSGNDLFDVGLKRVGIRLNPHPVQNPDTVEVWLVVARYVSPHRRGYFYFLCDFPGRDWSQEQIVAFAVRAYGQRWKIEEVHRHLKQDFGWEEIKLMRYQSLKNLNALFWLVVCFLYSLKSMVPGLKTCFSSIFIDRKSDWGEANYFIYYRLTNAIAICFSKVEKYTIKPWKGRWADSLQLRVNFS